VRITTRPRSRGGRRFALDPASISASIVVNPSATGLSCQAITAFRPFEAAAQSSMNSSS
jgi:hypothetical protein